ncbi:MAG: hypothetical protein ACYDD1_21055 [Caulobacteraceae bacterium]
MASSMITVEEAPELREDGEAGASLGDLLQTLAREIGDLANRTEVMQHLVSPLITDQSAEGLLGLQELDFIAQHLFAISSFVTQLEPHSDWRLDTHAAGLSVPLADLARRLTRPCEAHVAADTAGGELFLFD